MRKNFPLFKKNPPSLSKTYGFIIFLIIAVLIVYFANPEILSPISFPFIQTGRGMQNQSSNFLSFFTSRKTLSDKIDGLMRENEELKLANALMRETVREYEFSKNNADRSSKVVKITSQAPISPYDTIMINKGAQDGVAEGQKAIAYGSIILGKVENINNNGSAIKLLSYPGLKTEGYLESLSLNVVLEGIGGGAIRFSVPKGVEIKNGDSVFSSESAYLIGQVEYINQSESEPLQEIFIRAPINLKNLRFLEIRS